MTNPNVSFPLAGTGCARPNRVAPGLTRRVYRLLVVIGLAAGLFSTRVAWAGQIIHIVQPGENLFRIGLRYGVDWQSLMAANGLVSTQIYVGQALVIPSPGSQPAALTAAVPSPAAPAPAPAARTGTYIVQRGDTLWRIAQRHGLTVSGLMAANGLVDPNRIFAGQTLVMPGAAPAATKQLSVTGQLQAWPLDCEARSAVDWAAYFGTVIDEADFASRLPLSDDPDLGFVGDVRGQQGQLPPKSYGVHAEPVAALLQAYGLSARAARGLTWDSVRAEIDANRPVIVWVIGQSWPGTALDYTVPSSGRVTRVAAYEHTALVIGYSGEFVTLLDGATVYQASLTRFMASWGVLGNMAVLAE